MGKPWKVWQTLLSRVPKLRQMVTAAMKLKGICSLEEKYDQPRQHIKKRVSTLPTKVCLVKSMVFPLVMYECESWTVKEAEHWKIDSFELWCWKRLLRVPWTVRRSNPKGNQSWIFIGRPDAEVEATILWPPAAKNWLTGQDLDARKDWGQEEKGMTEDDMFGWHHWLDGHEFQQAPGIGDGQGSLACCSPWGRIESDTTERLNWTENLKNLF